MAAQRTAAALAVRSDEEGRPRALAVDWLSIGEPQPEQIEVIYDGQPLVVTDPDDIPLPAADDAFHYVSANVRFGDDQESRRETGFGGGVRAVEVAIELTAVAVRLDGRSRLPAPGKMASWFLEGGRPLAVHGVEKGRMHLYVVRGPGAQDVLDRLASVVARLSPGIGTDWTPAKFFSGSPVEIMRRSTQHHFQLQSLRELGPLGPQVSLHFLSPNPGLLAPAGLTREMFQRSPAVAGSEGGLSWLAQRQPPMSSTPRLATAVALAGMTAHGRHQRRAVLLVTAGAADDASETPPRVTRDYLRALGVPLYVWTFARAADPGWGDVVDLGDPADALKTARRLGKETEQLRRDLGKQRIVWLEGRHLPQQVERGPAARGVSLVGGL